MDLTTDLPDDVLCEVFRNIRTIRGKFRLAAVNQKFRRCMAIVFRKPQPLVMKLHRKRLNGRKIALSKWPQAVQVLAEKAQFSRIAVSFPIPEDQESIQSWYNGDYVNLLDEIMNILCNSDCLQQLAEFVFNARCGATVLQRFLEMSPKLSMLDLGVWLVPTRISGPYPLPINLTSALGGRPITELTLNLSQHKQKELFNLLHSIKPNLLQKLELGFDLMAVDMVQLLHELANDAAHREIRFRGGKLKRLEEMFALLPSLPQLHKCYVGGYPEVSRAQLVAIAVSLLNHSDRANPLEVKYLNGILNLPGCQVINFIQRVRNSHPGLQVQFDVDEEHDENPSMELKLALGNMTFVCLVPADQQSHCPGIDCNPCLSYYPSVVNALVIEADLTEQFFMQRYQIVDRCRIGSLVVHMKWMIEFLDMRLDALKAVRDDGVVEVTFEAGDGHEFDMAVRCAPCFNPACVACMTADVQMLDIA